jgi:hypothetical protein
MTIRDSGCRPDASDPEFCATHEDGIFGVEGRVCDIAQARHDQCCYLTQPTGAES